MDKEQELLMVGCGNAPFSESLHEAGFERQVNMDNCELVIEQQRTRLPHMQWEVMDVRHMDYDTGRFGVVFDKGLIDNLFCYLDADENSLLAVRDMYRVLSPGGQYIVFSCHPPAEIEAILGKEEFDWSWDTYMLRNPRFPEVRIPAYTMIVAIKGGAPPAATEAVAGQTSRQSFAELASAGLQSPEDGEPLFLAPEQVQELTQRAAEMNAASAARMRARSQQARAAAAEASPAHPPPSSTGAAAVSSSSPVTPATTNAEPPPTLAEQLQVRRTSLKSAPPPPTPPPLTMGTASGTAPPAAPDGEMELDAAVQTQLPIDTTPEDGGTWDKVV